MKIKVVGNGYSWMSRPNTSFLINDEMFLDVPQACTKFLYGKFDFSKTKYILITHFHSDHYVELHLFYDILKYAKLPYKVKIIAPKTALKHLLRLAKAIDVVRKRKDILKVFEFIELKPNQKIDVDKYEIETFKTEHGLKYSLGYVIKAKDCEKKIGFTGDSILCEGVIDLIEKSDVIFIDTSSIHDKHKTHMNIDDVLELHKRYPNKEFHSVHLPDWTFENMKEELNIPDCGEVLEF